MPSFIGFSGTDSRNVAKAYKAARQGLESLVADIYKGTGAGTKFHIQFKKYMGNAPSGAGGTKEFNSAITTLVETCKAMNAKIASFTFKVVYDANLGSNAEMLSFAIASKTASEIQDLVDGYAYAQGHGAMPMTVGPGMFANPAWAIDAQCHVESFLHELSHHAAGTIDDTQGGECYDLTGVNRLKAIGPTRAVRNAENVGFFCMAWVNRIT
jgi:hypothetical protein